MLVILFLLLPLLPAAGQSAPATGDGAALEAEVWPMAPQAADGGGRFVENLGQWGEEVDFVATTAFGHAVLGATSVTYDIAAPGGGGHRVRVSLAGARCEGPVGSGGAGPPTSYLMGNDPARWVAGARSYTEVVFRDAWPCVDVVYRFREGELKYDVVLRPGARASDVAFIVEGQESLVVGRDTIEVRLPGGLALRDRSLAAWYGDGLGEAVPVRFERRAGGYGFDVRCEPGRTVVIDPVVVHHSTLLGSSYDDAGMDVDVDAEGNLYVLSQPTTSDFPVTPGAYSEMVDSYDLAVTKLNHNCSQVIWSTFIGGRSIDVPIGLDLDDQGCVYVVGTTVSTDFPVTRDCFQQLLNMGKDHIQSDAFLCKLGVDGDSLAYSTYIGGAGPERPGDVRVRDGQAAVAGWTDSHDFPTESGFYGGVHGEAFLVVMSTDGQKMICSNFWGGFSGEAANALAFDRNGDIVVAGSTSSIDFWATPGTFQDKQPCLQCGFVSKYSPRTDEVLWSTYLGGVWELAEEIAVDDDLCVYITGIAFWGSYVFSYPTTDGAFDRTYNGRTDAFVTKMDPNGTRLIYSTLLGGDGDDHVTAIEVDGDGNAVLVGSVTSGANFTVTDGCVDPDWSGPSEGFLFILDANGSAPVYSTFLGGMEDDGLSGLAIDDLDNWVVVGATNSVDLTLAEDAYQGRVKGFIDVLVAVIGELLPTSAPRDLTAMGAEGRIDLAWEMPLDDGGYPVRDYIVLRGTSEDDLDFHAAVGRARLCTDTRVEWGVLYHYAVVADNGKGMSPRSNVASAMSVTVPSAPSNLTAVVEVDGVLLAWEASDFTGGLPVLEYRVYRSEAGDGMVPLAKTGPGGRAFKDLGAGDGLLLTYELRCANAFGESRANPRVTVRNHDVPTPPLGLRHTYGEVFINLSWDAPAQENGMPVVGYRVYRSSGTGPWQLVGEASSGARSFLDLDVEVGTMYMYRMTALNGKGESAHSEAHAAVAMVHPSPPRAVSASAEERAVRVSWSVPASDGASPVIGYWVYHATGPDGWANVGALYVEGREGVPLAFLHDAPYDGVARRYRVTAFNAEGESDPSEVATTVAYDVPGPPQGPRVAWGDGVLTLSWDPPLVDGGTPVRAYTVYRDPSPGGDRTALLTLPATAGRYVDDTTENGVEYTYWVCARNLAGEGAPSAAVSATPAGPPGPPVNVTAEGLDGRVRLAWEPPASTGGLPVLGYRVWGRSDGILGRMLAETGADARALEVDGLENARAYLFAVSAFTLAGESDLSEVAQAMPVGAPSAPMGLTAVWADGYVLLTWSAPALDGGAAVRGYRLSRDDRDAGNWTVLGAVDLTFLDHDVEPGRSYNYTLIALNEVGQGPSVTVAITVPVPEEAPPRARSTTLWPAAMLAAVLALAVLAGFLAGRRGRGLVLA